MTVGWFRFCSTRTPCRRSAHAHVSLTNAETQASSPEHARERGPRATRAEGRAGWAPGSCGLVDVPPAPMSESPGHVPAVLGLTDTLYSSSVISGAVGPHLHLEACVSAPRWNLSLQLSLCPRTPCWPVASAAGRGVLICSLVPNSSL